MKKILFILFLAITCHARQANHLDSRITLLYHFNEGSGVTASNSAINNGSAWDGTHNDTWVAGKYSTGLYFAPAVGNQLSNANVIIYTDSGTICFWGKRSGGTASSFFFVFFTPPFFYFGTGGCGWNAAPGVLFNADITNDGVWRHYAIVWLASANNTTLFINGVPSACGTCATAGQHTSGTFSIGHAGGSVDYTCDEFCIYNTNISTGEIKSLYLNGKKHHD